MEHFDRGERRYQIARLKIKRQWYYGQGRVRGTEGITPMTPRQLGRVVQYPANCSCWGCANDRKDHGLPIQELRMYQDLKEDRMPEELNPAVVEELGIKDFNVDDYLKTPEEREAYEQELKRLEDEGN